MVPFSHPSLALVSLQYELALAVGQELELSPMLRRFFAPALKLLGCNSAHVWLHSDDTFGFEHAFAYPAFDANTWGDHPGFSEAVKKWQTVPDSGDSCLIDASTYLQFLSMGSVGFCVLVRKHEPLEPRIVAALKPIVERLATACVASLEHRESERLRAFAAENEARLRTVVEAVGEVIFQTDRAGRLIFLNPAWTRITGRDIQDCLGMPLLGFFSDEDRDAADEVLTSVLARWEQSRRFEARLLALHREKVWVSAQIERRQNTGSTAIGMTGTLVDITTQREMIDQLIDARQAAEQASEAKSAFLANMSHEIRTPMNGVIGLAQLALEEDLSASARSHLEMILGSAEDLLVIINDILDFSKIEAGRLDFVEEPFDLRLSLDKALSPVRLGAERKGLDLSLKVNESVPFRVSGDPARLKQVLLNLLSNAVKFTHEGSIGLEVTTLEHNADHARLQFVVSDTGIGIAPEKQARIFEAFTQADGSVNRAYGGTGLGLTISQRLVDLMGGQLRLQSVPGKGSRFIFDARFRVAVAETPGPVSATDPELPSVALKILVAEDNAINRRLMAGLLEKLGHRFSFARDGQEAVDAFQSEEFDVVLMDMQMPVVDGLKATRLIRALESTEQRTPTPIVALTANAMQGDRERCLEAGMNAYLSKPVRTADLVATLACYLPRHPVAPRGLNPSSAPKP
ncbi:MAG: response regulator [Rhodocyclaceae bacterium]|jgi:PAS domain S-box-containing protein|nr:response regulator [Rhodocyclaceae bacterium]MCL4757445.1 response regulator [Rhodocyclaceae bacterium]